MKKLDSGVLLVSMYIEMGGTLRHSLGNTSLGLQEDTFMQDSEIRSSLPLWLAKSFERLTGFLGLREYRWQQTLTLPKGAKCMVVRVSSDSPITGLSIVYFQTFGLGTPPLHTSCLKSSEGR